MFVDTDPYPFTKVLEEAYPQIKRELLALSQETFQAWPERFLYGVGWDVFGLQAFGQKIEENCKKCPETFRAVSQVPKMTTAGFSKLQPGTEIVPHQGYTNQVLRCHLGLITPKDCALKVGEETRSWEEGKCFIFDDTVLHSACNRSDSQRIVLLIDFER